MSAAKHTPGPWHWPHDSNRLEPVNPDPTHSHVSSILDADGGYGWLGSPTSATLAELDADRRLIAAAPDLFAEAFKLIGDIDPENADPRFNGLRAAIAKATGAAA